MPHAAPLRSIDRNAAKQWPQSRGAAGETIRWPFWHAADHARHRVAHHIVQASTSMVLTSTGAQQGQPGQVWSLTIVMYAVQLRFSKKG